MAKKIAYVVTDKGIVKLVRKIQKHVLADPESFDMDVLMEHPEDLLDTETDAAALRKPHCGAVGCNAGWAATFSMGKKPKQALTTHLFSIWGTGSAALQLRKFKYDYDFESSNKASEMTREELAEFKAEYPGLPVATDNEVFYVDSWPEPFNTKFRTEVKKDKPSRKKLAKINVARLEYLLETGL